MSRRSRPSRWLAALLTACACAGPVALAAPPSWCVAVWYPSSEHPLGQESISRNLDVIDVVHPFWYTPAADGTVLSQAGEGWRDRVAEWRAGGLVVMPSVFASHSSFMTEPALSAHGDALLALVDDGGFDGLDLDYEEFPLETEDAFTSLVTALAVGLHARGKLLSVTVHAKTEAAPAGFPSAAAQDWPRLAAAADVINVMTYDYTSRNEPPGPVAPRSWVADVVEYGVGAVGADRLVVGLPLYGYLWKRGRPPAAATTWEASRRLVDQFGLTPDRDPDSLELHIELDVTGLPRQAVYVSDGLTTAGRLAALAESGRGTAGVALWGLGGEDPAVWDALREARPAACALRPGAQGASAPRLTGMVLA